MILTRLAKIGGIMVALAGMWSVALTVIGVAVKERSKDKAVAAGIPPKGRSPFFDNREGEMTTK